MRTTLALALMIASTGCQGPMVSPSPSPDAPLVFESIIFTVDEAYFATDGSMLGPVTGEEAQVNADRIDLTFTYDDDYNEPGFLTPVTRSQEWYWNRYRQPWLSDAIEVDFFVTRITSDDFQAAKRDESRVRWLFNRYRGARTPHSVFPEGSCVGGRDTEDGVGLGGVFAFQHRATGRLGLIRLTDSQPSTPLLSSGNRVRVDIIAEH